MASGGDVMDILNVPRASRGDLPGILSPPVPKSERERKRKPGFLNAPLVVATPAPVVPSMPLKAKRKLGKKRAQAWLWHPFTNGARSDNLTLHHWIRAADKDSSAYQFSKFNKITKMQEYSSEEYDRLLIDPSWTKAETDELWELCARFDLRWAVIADRFTGEKPLEVLKERYYDITSRLLSERIPREEASKHPIMSFTYDREADIARKKHNERIESRTQEQIKDEEYLATELKRIESTQKKTEKQKKKALKLSSSLTEMRASGGDLGDGVLIPGEEGQKKRQAGVFLRSQKIWATPANLGQRAQKRMEAVLDELGVGTRPLPTAAVGEAFNALRHDVLTLLEMQSSLEKHHYDLQLRAQVDPSIAASKSEKKKRSGSTGDTGYEPKKGKKHKITDE